MESQLLIGILVVYLSSLIAIGFYSSRMVHSAKGFFLANRSLGGFALTATISATVIGGSATIATGALIYRSGLPGLWLDIGGGIGLIVLGYTLAKIVRKTGLYTLPEITGYLFDKKVRFASSFLIVLIQIAWISLLIQGSSTVLSVILPLEYEILLVVITLIFISYTLIGGQFAVVYTDIIQFIVMVIGICILAAPLLFMEAASEFGSIPSEYLSFPTNSNIGVLPGLAFFFMMLMPHIVGPDIYSKLLSAKDEKTAKYGAIISGIFKIIFAIAIGIIALSALVLVPGLTADESSLALPMAIMYLNPVVAGLVLASFISVMLSSADSVLLSAGTIISVDLTRKKNIIVSRIGILIIGILALILALYLKDIIDTLKLAYTVFTAGLTLPIIFGFYKDKTKVTSSGALMSLILGGSISLIWLYLESTFLKSYYSGSYAVLIGLSMSVIPLIFVRSRNKTL